MLKAITGSKIFDGHEFYQDYSLLLDGTQILAMLPNSDLSNSELYDEIEIEELAGGILAPGFIDLQVNGGGGVLFNNDPTPTALATMVNGHRSGGTTGMLPTLISDSNEILKKGAESVTQALNNQQPGILGLHIEGPFFAKSRRGAHQENFIRNMNAEDIDWLQDLASDKFNQGRLMVTLAPEQSEPEQIRSLSSNHIIVCAGHTNGNYDQIKQAQAEGLCGFTHLFNAMSPLENRQPGVVGAALDCPRSYCGIIADGHHVHPANIRVSFFAKRQNKGFGKLFLVTDAMATVGSEATEFEIYGETVKEQNGRLVNAEGRLAGSAISMIEAVQYCVEQVELPLNEALRMASLYPAQFIEQSQLRGQLQPGAQADLVHFSENFKVKNTWIAGSKQTHS